MFRNLKRFAKEYFSYSLSERKAIWIIVCIIVILIFLPNIYIKFHSDHDQTLVNTDFSEFDSSFKSIEVKKVNKAINIEKNFDPNKLTKNEWIAIGLNEKTAYIIENYLKKGGKFRKKTDLLKIYGFDSSYYAQISNYIYIADFDSTKKNHNTIISLNKPQKNWTETKKNNNLLIEINSSDSAQFDQLPGIGKILASRIVKFRKLLGGFYSITQLNEVHGLQAETYNKIAAHVYCDTLNIQRIDLNTVSENALRKHPYIGKYKANLIIKYRNFAKKIANPSELVMNNILTKEEFQKLHYYLK